MVTVDVMLDKFKGVMLDIENIATDVLQATQQELVTFNENQLMQGIGADGNKLPTYRSDAYARKKNAMNPLPGLGFPDYKLTGALYDKMETLFKAGSLQIISKVDYFDSVLNRGGDPMGLTTDSKNGYVKTYFNPRFITEIGNRTGARVS